MSFDDAGELESLTMPLGGAHAMSYAPLGQLVSYLSPRDDAQGFLPGRPFSDRMTRDA